MKEHMRKYFPERFEDSQKIEAKDLFSTRASQLLNYKQKTQTGKCEYLVNKVFQESSEVKLLVGAMKRYGCNFELARHVSCEGCIDCHGGFDTDYNQIIICNNNYLNKDKVMATMLHEMIHMFDYCRANFDFNNLEHVACSEIRAANLTYCGLQDRLRLGGPGFFNFKKTHRYCVQDVAFRSVKAYSPETEDSKIWNIVDRIFPFCYNDLEPFGRRPTSGKEALKQSYRERYYYGYV